MVGGGRQVGAALRQDHVLHAEIVGADHDARGELVERVDEITGEGGVTDQPAAQHVAEVLDGHVHLAFRNKRLQEGDSILNL